MNKFRGETVITLNGKEYTLRPTFEAMVEFEDRAGISAFEAMRRLIEKQEAGFKLIAAAFYAGIKAGWPGPRGFPSYGEVGGWIQSAGLGAVLNDYATFLSNALTSDADLAKAREDEAKGKPAASMA